MLLHGHVADDSFSLSKWQQFSVWNGIMVAILKFWSQNENPYFVNQYIFTREEQFCHISSRSDLKLWSLRLIWRVTPTRRTRWVL